MADGFRLRWRTPRWTTIVGTNANYIQLAIGAPGSAGTANPSSVTTRESVTWDSASAGSVSASNEPEWTSWAGTSRRDRHGHLALVGCLVRARSACRCSWPHR